MTDFGRSFSFPFRGPAWLNRLAVGALFELLPFLLMLPSLLAILRRHRLPGPPGLVLLPVAGALGLAGRFVVLGYLRRVAKDVIAGGGDELPAWDRFADDVVEGLKLWLVGVALFLPAVAVVAGLTLLVMAVSSPAWAWLPILLVAPPAVLLTLGYLPAGLLAAVAKDELAAAFDLEGVGRTIGGLIGPYALGFLVAIAAEIVAQLGLVVCCVGIFATRFAAHCVVTHAFATVYREAQPPPAAAPAEAAAG